MKYVVIRIKNHTWVIFEDDFLEHNEFRTQNIIIYVLSLLYEKQDYDVELRQKRLTQS